MQPTNKKGQVAANQRLTVQAELGNCAQNDPKNKATSLMGINELYGKSI